MGFFLLSLFFCGFFGFGFLLILQYIFITFQNRRLAGEIIAKKVLALPSFGQSYNRALMVLTARDKPLWLTRIVLRMDKIWQTLATKIHKLINYFQNLTTQNQSENKENEENKFKIETKVNNSQNSSQNGQKNTNKQQNSANFKINSTNLSTDLDHNFDDFKIIPKEKISNSIPNTNSKTNSQNSTFTTTIPTNNYNFETKNPRKSTKTVDIWDNLQAEKIEKNEEFEQNQNSNSNQTATIGMVGGVVKNPDEMTPFEKQENKILTKLQTLQENNLGLNHWDLWLDLGDLYGKYAQKDKQKEIYTFILSKANNSDKEKELATFRLIGMN